MKWVWRWLIGCVVFVAIMLFGYYVLHIEPTLSEALLVIVAMALSNGIEEGLK